MLSLCPLCPEKLKPPGEQTDSITLPLNWGSPASLRRHYHLVNTRCIGFPGKPRSSVRGVWKSKPNPRLTHPSHSGAQGPLSCTQAAPSWSLLQCTVTFSSRASPACSVGLWLARTPHSAPGPGDPACAWCCGGHSREGLAALARLRVGVSAAVAHLPDSQLFFQWVEGCRLRLSVASGCTPPLDPSFPCTPWTVML